MEICIWKLLIVAPSPPKKAGCSKSSKADIQKGVKPKEKGPWLQLPQAIPLPFNLPKKINFPFT